MQHAEAPQDQRLQDDLFLVAGSSLRHPLDPASAPLIDHVVVGAGHGGSQPGAELSPASAMLSWRRRG